jgi:hypothetical protein
VVVNGLIESLRMQPQPISWSKTRIMNEYINREKLQPEIGEVNFLQRREKTGLDLQMGICDEFI